MFNILYRQVAGNFKKLLQVKCA